MSFEGIPVVALDFYEDLEADNSKAFWTAHKGIYDASVKGPLEAFAGEVSHEFGMPKLFRPYRDIRFARDKTPYKTHQGIWFPQSSRYLQVSAAGLMVAAGYWETSTAQVERLRRSVADDLAGPALEQTLAAAVAARYSVGGHVLARVPTGYDKDHPRADLLRHKTLTVSREVGSPAWLSTRRAKTEITKLLRAAGPVVDWLDQHVGLD